MDDLQCIVETMLPMIEQRFTAAPSTFKLWFGDFVLTSLDDSEAVFLTPTELRKKILSTKYMDLISETLSEIIGFSVNIRIESKEAINARLTEADVPSLSVTKEDAEENLDREIKIRSLIGDTADLSEDDKRVVTDDYTFDSFIEGASNKFAKAVCFAVANSPATDFNPLFIHGNSGLGKTHLLCAIINHMKIKFPHLKIVYRKCEEFMNELISAISNYTTNEFKEKYRGADVLLIDDIQFIAGKVSTQEEFFHTFSALYESDKQIILASDRPPREIKPLEDRLRTRFESGLLADVQPPSYELRVAIIRKKAEYMGLKISSEMVDYMADKLRSNIRQIEGVIKRLYAIYSLTSAEVTKEKIDEVISVIDPGNIPIDAMIEKILSAVSRTFGVSASDMKSKRKTEDVANARHAAIYIVKNTTHLTLKEIGAIFGRDHATIISSLKKVDENIRTVNNYEGMINRLIKEIKE